MNRTRLVTLAIGLAAAVLGPVPAHAQGMEGTRSVSVSLGTGLGLAGNVIEEAVGAIDGTPAVFVEQAYSNHFSDGMRLRFMGNYGLDYNKEAFATFAYGRFNGTERITGSVGGYPLYTRFSNGDAFDIEGGLRYYFLPEGPTRTYAAGVIGVRFLQSTDVTVIVRELGLTMADVPYFDTSTLFLFGGDAGISRDLSDTIAVGAEIGLRFHGKPGAEMIFEDESLAPVNDTGSRWSIPISAIVTVRF
ncbi:MAG TPA: hypothetical protein VLD67_06435 [Vicinamibacterales bacterium]|nr:hypothetical protein [Vicinamibacterales bacterium]